jgi:DNA-binding NtrC family response regulator
LDFRIIAATNKDIAAELASNRFRLDLYYRINVVPIHLPPLRERLEDLPLLADHFLEKVAKKLDKPVPKLSTRALSSLLSHPWPGNVRELENVLERAMIFAKDDVISEIPFGGRSIQPPISEGRQSFEFDSDLPLTVVKDQAIAQIEKEYLAVLLRKNKGSINRTAAQAHIDTRTVLRKMKLYGLSKGDFK